MADPNPESVVVPIRDDVAEAINQGEHKAAEASLPHSMTSSIFISYASKDRAAAHTICDALENRGFHCWIADRDIGPGENFQVSIVHAIRSAKAMILVFSANSANSEEIKKEIVLAGQSRLVVIPVRVEDVTPDEAFAYEMATRQWVDLFGDWEQSIQRLVRQLETVVHVKSDLKVAAGTPVVREGWAHKAEGQAQSSPTLQGEHHRGSPSRVNKWVILLAGCVALSVMVVAVAVLRYNGSPSTAPPVSASPTPMPQRALTPPAPNLQQGWESRYFPPPNGGMLVFRTIGGNPACASYNGRDCLWGQNINQIDFSRVHPLICGANHREVWGITGYENPSHWCNLAKE